MRALLVGASLLALAAPAARAQQDDGSTAHVVEAAPPPTSAEPAAEPARDRLGRFTFTVGPVYGHNFQEKDRGRTADDFGGAELRFDALPGRLRA